MLPAITLEMGRGLWLGMLRALIGGQAGEVIDCDEVTDVVRSSLGR